MRRTVLLIAALLVACAGTQPTPEQRAVMLVDKGQNGEAIRVLSDYLKQHPDALKERRLLIRIIALTGDLGRAAAEAEQLAKYLPSGDPSPWIEMGHAYELAHRYDEALSMYDRAAQVAPKDAAGPKEGGCARRAGARSSWPSPGSRKQRVVPPPTPRCGTRWVWCGSSCGTSPAPSWPTAPDFGPTRGRSRTGSASRRWR